VALQIENVSKDYPTGPSTASRVSEEPQRPFFVCGAGICVECCRKSYCRRIVEHVTKARKLTTNGRGEHGQVKVLEWLNSVDKEVVPFPKVAIGVGFKVWALCCCHGRNGRNSGDDRA
jgi:hypothetical protein